jgi:hypothetical protein
VELVFIRKEIEVALAGGRRVPSMVTVAFVHSGRMELGKDNCGDGMMI